MPIRSVIGPFFVLLLLVVAGCGGDDNSAGAQPPCVLPEETMADILDRDDVFAVAQDDGVQCIYGSDGQPLVAVSVRTPEQFQAERDRFEDGGVELPELVAVSGFDGEATVDPRYNSLNVTAGDRIVSVEIVGLAPSDPAAQVELEKEIAHAAVDRL